MSKQMQSIRHSMKSMDKYSNEKGYSLYQLQTLNNKLESEQKQKKKFLQKMKQQRIISQKIGQYVNESIGKVENTGAHFASRLQQQRRKYNILTTLVQHYESVIYNEKKLKHQQTMKVKKISKPGATSSQFNKPQVNTQSNQIQQQQQMSTNLQLEQTLRLLDQLERSYEQFIVKNNNSQYELSNKLNQVRTLRSERTIFNKVFDQFQKQLFNHEFAYKQLVIERSALETFFEQKIKEYDIIYVKAEKQCQKLIKNHKKKLQTERNQFLHELSTKRQCLTQFNDGKQFTYETQRLHQNQKRPLLLSSNRFTIAQQVQIRDSQIKTDTREQQSQIKDKSFGQRKVDFKLNPGCLSRLNNRTFPNNINSKNSQKKTGRDKPINESKKFQYEKIVKDLYNDLKIGSSSQVPQLVNNLEQKVEDLYKQAQQLYEKIYRKQKFLESTFKQFKQKDKSIPLMFEGGSISGESEQNRKMQELITQRQQLYDKISKSADEKQKITKEMDNFMKKQVLKLKEIFDEDEINLDEFQEQSGGQVRGENVERVISKLERILIKIIPVERSNFLCNTEKTKKQRRTKRNKQKLNESVDQKDTDSRRDTNKSMQSENILGNLGNNSQFLKQRQYREKNIESTKQKYSHDGTLSNQDQYDESCLEQILRLNRTTHNNMSIYSQQQLIQISKLNLNMAKSKNKKKNQSGSMHKQSKAQTGRNTEQAIENEKQKNQGQNKTQCLCEQNYVNLPGYNRSLH